MTEQTPKERLEEAIEEWNETEVADFDSGDRVVGAAIAYRDAAEARIKELEVENSNPEETVRLKDTIRELESQITALKKLDDDNNADSVRRLKQMEEDKRTIKELEADADEYKDVIKTANQTALDYMDKYKKAQAKLKAWDNAPRVAVCWNSNTFQHPVLDVRALHDGSLSVGTYHLKPKETDDAQGN